MEVSKKNYCLISGLFENDKFFHTHQHHNPESNISWLKKLGKLNGILVFSSLGDTQCVIKSIDLNEKNICINIGTGSQIFYKQNDKIIIHKYFPAGRALNTYQQFFKSLGLDIFKLYKNIKLSDVINSSLSIDNNVFPQSINYLNGGRIINIQEDNFEYKNLLGSILKSIVLQYQIYLPNRKNIILSGGIPHKMKIVEQSFRYFYPNHKIILNKEEYSTHLGMIKYIEQYL